MGVTDQIRRYADEEDFAEAARIAFEATDGARPAPAVMNAMYHLTAKLRSRCLDLAAKRRDSGPDFEALESLLYKLNAVTGEDMYGRIV
jgi:hypothetical protein